MKKFKCRVEVTSEYEIELDENYFDESFVEHFQKYYADFHDLEEHAKYIAERKAEGDTFIEGYGVPLVNGKPPFGKENDKSLNLAINIKVIEENEEYTYVVY